jgi:hypothetical protein
LLWRRRRKMKVEKLPNYLADEFAKIGA